LAKLLAAATAGMPPAGPANKRRPVRIVLDPDDQPIAKGKLCAQEYGFNLHGATRVAANDKQGRLTLCKYILRPPLANDRLKILDDETVRIDFKKPCLMALPVSTLRRSPSSRVLQLSFRLPKGIPSDILAYFRHTPLHAATSSPSPPSPRLRLRLPSRTSQEHIKVYFLVRTFAPYVRDRNSLHQVQVQLRLIALIKTEDIAKKILTAMHLPVDIPQLRPARPPPHKAGGGDDWLN
jgi:hypothetical protein